MQVGQLAELFDEFSDVRILDGLGLNNHLHCQILENLLEDVLNPLLLFGNVERLQDAVPLAGGFALPVSIFIFNLCASYPCLFQGIPVIPCIS